MKPETETRTQAATRREKALNRTIPDDFNALENFAWGRTHFFEPRTRRFFASRNVGDPRRDPKTGAVYFVDSTKSGFNDPTRRFNLHRASFQKHRGRFAFSVSSPLETYPSRGAALRALADAVGVRA